MHHQQTKLKQNNQENGIVRRHLFMLIVGIVTLIIMYLGSRNMRLVGLAAVLFLLAHVVAVFVIMYSGRSLLATVIRKMHAQPEPHSHGHSEVHHHGDGETEGRTISWAWFYDIFTKVLFGGMVQKMMKSTVKLAKIQSGEKVLDVGCGTGTLAVLAKQTTRDAEISGIDASPEMIARAQQKAKQQQVDVDFQIGLVEDLRFPEDSFDVVMNSLMFHHLPSADLKKKALQEMLRVLKPGGRVLVVDFEPPKPGLYKSFLTMILGDMTSIDNTTVPLILEEVGFIQVEMGSTDSPIASYVAGVKPIQNDFR